MAGELILQVSQGIALIAFAPGVFGWLCYFRETGQGRRRRWLTYWLQPYRDLIKLFRQPAVRPQTTSWLFGLTPSIVYVAYAWLAFVVPVFRPLPLLSVDIIVVIYVLGLARFALSLAGWDSGSSFGGLGSSREMYLYFLTEIGLILLLAALALQWRTIDLAQIFTRHAEIMEGIGQNPTQIVRLLALLPSLVILILFESNRIPVDNPDTHLELTMDQKAITLEYAGRDLALIEWAEMIKLAFLYTLFGDLFISFLNPAHWLSLNSALVSVLVWSVFFTLQIVLFALVTAWWELRQPKLRLRSVIGLARFSMLFSIVSILFTVLT